MTRVAPNTTTGAIGAYTKATVMTKSKLTLTVWYSNKYGLVRLRMSRGV